MNAKGLYGLAFLALALPSNFGQGQILFSNRNIPTASGTGGGNGNGTYNVPIWASGTINQGAGNLPGGVTVGLFTATGKMVGSTPLRNDASSQFFAIGSQTLTIPDSDAGTTPTLTVRAWQGAGGFGAAQASGAYWGEWTFISKPLGGMSMNGVLFSIPGMTGWGPESGAGLSQCLDCVPIANLHMTLQPGFNMIANPLNSFDNHVGSLFRNVSGGIPGGFTIYFLEPDGSFVATVWDDLDNQFVPTDIANRILLPGDGVFVFLPSTTNRTLTISGQYPGQVCTTVPRGYSIKAGLGAPTYQITISPTPADTIYFYNPATKNYTARMYDDLDARWVPDLPTPN